MKKHGEERIHQVLVKLLDGKHRTLNFTTSTITIETLKHKIQALTSIPSHLQLLLLPFNQPTLLHHDHQILNLRNHDLRSSRNDNFPLIVHLLLRLRGGKGGFGSLLRGAATKAGQKKTNNFDACRDMSGRRLRHVNAEKKLEEWMAEAEERKLEKMAEEYIKKKAKELNKGKGKGGKDIDKYVNKYREDSAKCMEEVERSVRESIKSLVGSKRKSAEAKESNSKRFKIWMGKRKLGDSDSEDVDDDDSDEDEEENNKSDVTENGNLSDSSREADQSLGSVIDTKHDVVSFDGVPPEVCLDEEKGMVAEQYQYPDGSSSECAEGTCASQPDLGVSEEETSEANKFSLEMSAISGTTKDEVPEIDSYNSVERVSQPSTLSSSGKEETFGADINDKCIPKTGIQEEVVTASADALHSEKPLNLQEFNSASELEVLGMERLKSELQARGLKCGGTLQERAARLFLLKTTPLELLPKKLLAKK